MDRRTGARRILGGYAVDIEGNVESVGAAACDLDGALDDFPHAEAVDSVDGEDGNTGLLHALAFLPVDVAACDLDAMLRVNESRPLAVVHHAVRAPAAQGGEGHAVHVAGLGGFVIVPVAVGVHPDDADVAAMSLGNSACSAGRGGVVAAQHDRERALFQALFRAFVQALIHIDHLIVIAQFFAGASAVELYEVALVVQFVTEIADALADAGEADGFGSDADAALGGALVDLGADKVDSLVLHGVLLFYTNRC